jgi:hypothetical protein
MLPQAGRKGGGNVQRVVAEGIWAASLFESIPTFSEILTRGTIHFKSLTFAMPDWSGEIILAA